MQTINQKSKKNSLLKCSNNNNYLVLQGEMQRWWVLVQQWNLQQKKWRKLLNNQALKKIYSRDKEEVLLNMQMRNSNQFLKKFTPLKASKIWNNLSRNSNNCSNLSCSNNNYKMKAYLKVCLRVIPLIRPLQEKKIRLI